MTKPKLYVDVACYVDGCDRPATERGMCHRHYQAWQRSGTAFGCAVDDCEAGPVARGLCAKHYRRLLRTGNVGDHVRTFSHSKLSLEERRQANAWRVATGFPPLYTDVPP